MSEAPGAPKIEIARPEFVIKNNAGILEIASPKVDLDSEREPLRFAVTLAKTPTPIEFGSTIENIKIDRESPKLQDMLGQAQALKNIPAREKPRRLLELLRSNVHFAYTDVLDEVAKINSDLAQWVSENTGINSSSARPISLSEVVDKGYGVCRHLSVAILVLAKEAGLEGAYLTYAPGFGPMSEKYLAKNVIRKDNNEPLFKMSGVGQGIGGHAWVELKTGEDEWIPVDPSTQLVGDTPEGFETFRDANYRALVSQSLDVEGFPGPVNHQGTQDLWFLPGEAQHTGVLEVNSLPRQKPIRLTLGRNNEIVDEKSPDDQEQWPKPTQHSGVLNFQISSHASTNGLTVAVVEARSL